MENMDKIFGIPWLAWIILAVAMVVTVFATEYIKPLVLKWSNKRKAKGKCGINIPPIVLFWIIGILVFTGLHFIGWMKFGPVPVMIYIVIGGALNVGYYNDFLKLRTVIRKLILGEVPIPDLNEK
jgi:hypothetical protein